MEQPLYMNMNVVVSLIVNSSDSMSLSMIVSVSVK